jgi:23S rRNA (adenine2503-C2)-methyltransferase
MLPEDWRVFFTAMGEKPFRADQVFAWIHQHEACGFAGMTSLSKILRAKLEAQFPWPGLAEDRRTEGADGTCKVLFRTPEGHGIESVLMPKGRFRTVCLSTQAGCALACAFCATGRAGLARNLGAEEIIDQALHLGRIAGGKPSLSHIVFMGMGEPLLNCDAVFRAVRIFTHPEGWGWSPARITISTAGIVKGLERLREADLSVNVALSLNAPNEALRRRLMPSAKKNPLADVLKAFRQIPASHRNPRTIDYVLLSGVNDGLAEAAQLSRLASRADAKVNLIPFNRVEGIPFRPPTEEGIQAFLRVLLAGGIRATVRRSRGAGIGAACGQLAGGAS